MPAKTPVLVSGGDSVAFEIYKFGLDGKVVGVKCKNIAVSGENSAQALERLPRFLKGVCDGDGDGSGKFRYVVFVSTGLNDINGRQGETISNVCKMDAIVRSHQTTARSCIELHFLAPTAQSSMPSSVDRSAGVYQKLSSVADRISVLSIPLILRKWLCKTGQRTVLKEEDLLSDVHLTERGSRMLGKALVYFVVHGIPDDVRLKHVPEEATRRSRSGASAPAVVLPPILEVVAMDDAAQADAVEEDGVSVTGCESDGADDAMRTDEPPIEPSLTRSMGEAPQKREKRVLGKNQRKTKAATPYHRPAAAKNISERMNFLSGALQVPVDAKGYLNMQWSPHTDEPSHLTEGQKQTVLESLFPSSETRTTCSDLLSRLQNEHHATIMLQLRPRRTNVGVFKDDLYYHIKQNDALVPLHKSPKHKLCRSNKDLEALIAQIASAASA